MAKRYLAGNTSFLAHAGIKALRQLPVADMQRRFLDITVAGSALVLLSPLLALTALAIKADSRGPVLFSQTRVGRFIRRFSIDELPQILNVLRGEMAIVGPRPALPCEVAAYPARALGRLAVKPGITGVWQVSGRATIGFDQMVEMDLSYADSRTLMLDLILILKTFGAVTSGRGAY